MKQNSPNQAMCPSGLTGRAFSRVMERLNEPVYSIVLDSMNSAPNHSLLEIGFGTGRFLEMALERTQPLRIVGVDPSQLMLDVANKRLARFTPDNQISLRRGDDTSVPGNGSFKHIVAIHSFQFWQDPGETLLRIHGCLAVGGEVVLALRKHGARPPEWLPNTISRCGSEVDMLGRVTQPMGYTGPVIVSETKHTTVVRFTVLKK